MTENIFFELRRKVFHLLGLLFLATYIIVAFYFGKSFGLLALIFILILLLILEFFRIQLKKKIPFLHRLWRNKEKNSLGGEVYYVIGMIITFSVFDFNIAVAAVLMTTFGDMAAALIGIRFGKHQMFNLKNRDWEGAAAEFVIDIVIGIFLISNFIIVISMALAATFVERTFLHADDNLMIPVFAGFVGQILTLIL